MNYKDMDIKSSYISYGKENIASALINPALSCTKLYRRSVGFFSSGVFDLIQSGIISLVHNRGRIQLIASPHMSADDIAAIKAGYEQRDNLIHERFTEQFLNTIEEFNDNEVRMLAELISGNYLDIKIAVTNEYGMYHDKLGILEDFDGNTVVFYGSANSSYAAYHDNYEKIRIAKSWIDGQKESVKSEIAEFDSLWNGTNPYVHIHEYTECAKANLFKVIEKRKNQKASPTGIKLRDYQEQAIQAWVNNNYHGFYVMATGTGKTWTAIYAAKRLVSSHPALITICAPYKHLVKQWADDVQKAFPEAKIIMISSENAEWHKQMSREIIRNNINRKNQIILISTIKSFSSKRFMDLLKTSNEEKLLIVDEAHRFTSPSESLQVIYQYMLGLSATPFSGKDAARGLALMEFFGGQVFNLPIEDALDRGFLVPYYYYPLIVYATEEEEERFQKLTNQIAGCFRHNVCIDPEGLAKLLRSRLRVIAMASEKLPRLEDFVSDFGDRDHFVVYCGDGKQFDASVGAEQRHIQTVKRILTKHGYKASQFTATENMNERMQLVDAFNKGDISTLVAIRCLDEGINIPSIETALILASNDDYREFVQRRGRILRTYKGKESAVIYDMVVLPSKHLKNWANIELRRFGEYAKLAINSIDLDEQLDEYLEYYDLTRDDIDVYNYDEMEITTDE